MTNTQKAYMELARSDQEVQVYIHIYRYIFMNICLCVYINMCV
jgi:hypothetical protein